MNSILRPKARTACKARTLGSWFRISLISAFLFAVLSCAGVDLSIGPSPVQGALLQECQWIHSFRVISES
jgi:hypothetical protein